jgi:hypothetical protein
MVTLAESSQMYDIKISDKFSTSGAIPGTGTIGAGAGFNFSNENFEIIMPSNGGLDLFSHEMKHAYQFETGAFSTGYMRNGTPFYDKTDEWEGYSRGVLFGGDRIHSLPSIYNNLQNGPMDATKLAPIILNSPSELQRVANRTKSAFRINGVTYKMR